MTMKQQQEFAWEEHPEIHMVSDTLVQSVFAFISFYIKSLPQVHSTNYHKVAFAELCFVMTSLEVILEIFLEIHPKTT